MNKIHLSSLNKTLITVFTTLFSAGIIFAQNPPLTIEKLPKVSWSKQYKDDQKADSEKEALLQFLLKDGERIEFEIGGYPDSESTLYYALSLYSVLFIDLDFDGDLDLLYYGRSGSLSQTATKVYYNLGGYLEFDSLLPDGILDIQKHEDYYDVYTLFQPCCGSFTTIINRYKFSASEKGSFQESISHIGRTYFPYNGMPDFESLPETILKKESQLIAFSRTIKSGYFKERKKEVQQKLKEDGFIKLIQLKDETKAKIISETNFKGKDYVLIITEPLNEIPKFPEVLYEKNEGNNRRLIGWVLKENLVNH